MSDAVCSGEQGEVIRVRCGMAGVRVGEAANPGPGRESRRRRRISSSDECVSEVENPGPPRSRIPHGSETVEFDLTWGDSDDEPSSHPQLVPCHHSPRGSTTVARRQRANAVCEGWGVQPAAAICCEAEFGTSSLESTSAIQWTGSFRLLHRPW